MEEESKVEGNAVAPAGEEEEEEEASDPELEELLDGKLSSLAVTYTNLANSYPGHAVDALVK